MLPYVRRLSERGVSVDLHSREPTMPEPRVLAAMSTPSLTWHPHPFRPGGTRAALRRIVEDAWTLRHADLVHARSDLAAGAALLSRRRRWVWDIRSFWVDERVAMGLVGPGSRSERVMRAIETRAAAESSAIITLADAAHDVLKDRHGDAAVAKASTITTCVDLERFAVTEPPPNRLSCLVSGSFNPLYDLRRTSLVLEEVRRRGGKVTFLRPASSPLDSSVAAVGGVLGTSTFGQMPAHIAAHDFGLSIWRDDLGVIGQAATPTKVGEFLAVGRPVLVSAGLGDLDAILAQHRAGAVLTSSDDGVTEGLDQIEALLDDPSTPARCRRAAEEHFSLETGVDRLLAIYADVTTPA